MTGSDVPGGADRPDPERTVEQVRLPRPVPRRDRIAAEVQRNRRGEYRVPTWVFAVGTVLLIAVWLLFVMTV